MYRLFGLREQSWLAESTLPVARRSRKGGIAVSPHDPQVQDPRGSGDRSNWGVPDNPAYANCPICGEEVFTRALPDHIGDCAEEASA